jgi:hypothetical protein
VRWNRINSVIIETMKTKTIFSKIAVLVLGLGMAVAVSYVSADWTAPTTSAPLCPAGSPGCDAPVNVGTVGQVKDGSLSVNAFIANMNALFKQDVTLDKFKAGATRPVSAGNEELLCTDKAGKVVSCDNLINANGNLVISMTDYCGLGLSAPSEPSQLDYYRTGNAVHIFGVVRFNISGSKQYLCASIDGLPKSFPANGNPVIVRRPAAFSFYQNSKWNTRTGTVDLNRYNGKDVLSFSQDGDVAFGDPGTIPSSGEWMAFVDFSY